MSTRQGTTPARTATLVVVSHLLLALGLSACAPVGGEPEAPAPDTLEGRVMATGGAPEPLTTLVTEDRSVVLRGDLLPELSRLDGATVRVTGRLEGDGPGDALLVLEYELLRIDGQTPRVGVLVMGERGVALETDSGERLTLVGAPAALGDRLGARVWVVGPLQEGALLLQSYGMIRPADG